jgi:lysophospholipase L1-like esterase
MNERRFPPFRLKRSVRALAAGSLAFGALMAAHAQTPTPTRRAPAVVHDARWQSSFDAFAAADLARAPQAGGVVFVGSSSIRLWNDLEHTFQTQPPIVKRGFGGSRLSDCSSNLQRLVLPYKPRLVVIYAGDNDLAEGATPQQVLESFEAFVRGVRAELPDTRIAFVSIKPSPLRENLMTAAHAANALIEAYARGESNVDFVDVYSKMLGQDGRPRTDLFGADKLHLNEAGYALWKRELSAHLKL